jgi:hypothetical protein
MMVGALLSVRLTPRLARALDHAADRKGCPPGRLIEVVIQAVEAHREEVLKTPLYGPLSQKKTFRVDPEALARLKALAGDLEPSAFLRLALARVFSASGSPADDQIVDNHHGKDEQAVVRGTPSPVALLIFLAVVFGAVLVVGGLLHIHPPTPAEPQEPESLGSGPRLAEDSDPVRPGPQDEEHRSR